MCIQNKERLGEYKLQKGIGDFMPIQQTDDKGVGGQDGN